MSRHSAMSHGIRILFAVVVTGIVASGCRTYGGYDSESATYTQIRAAHQIFQEELVRAQADLEKLLSAATQHQVLSLFATQYARVVEGHEAVQDDHADLIAGLSPESDYRELHRVFGAIISQQNTIRVQYEGVLDTMYRAYMSPATTSVVERPYALIPPYYERIRQKERGLTMNEVLVAVQSGRAPASGFGLPSAERSEADADSVSEAGAVTPSEGGAVDAEVEGTGQ